jgi:hypothetical protein
MREGALILLKLDVPKLGARAFMRVTLCQII